MNGIFSTASEAITRAYVGELLISIGEDKIISTINSISIINGLMEFSTEAGSYNANEGDTVIIITNPNFKDSSLRPIPAHGLLIPKEEFFGDLNKYQYYIIYCECHACTDTLTHYWVKCLDNKDKDLLNHPEITHIWIDTEDDE